MHCTLSFCTDQPGSTQIYLVTLRPRLLTQASFFQKNQMLQNVFLMSVTLRFAKIRVFKVDHFALPLFSLPKLRSVAQNEWKKHPYIFFLLLVQK